MIHSHVCIGHVLSNDTSTQAALPGDKNSEIHKIPHRMWPFFSPNHAWFQAQYLLHCASELIEMWFVCKEVLCLYNVEVRFNIQCVVPKI